MRFVTNTISTASFQIGASVRLIAFSQAADLSHYDKRETHYLEIARKYDKSEMTTLSEILGEVTLAMEERPQDVLGCVFHALELHNAARGQFFTPYSICPMMVRRYCQVV